LEKSDFRRELRFAIMLHQFLHVEDDEASISAKWSSVLNVVVNFMT
jgi:hypothetical protein